MNSRRPRAHVARGDAPAAIAVLYGTARTGLNSGAHARRSIVSARCLSIAPPSLSTAPPSALADLAYAVGNHGRPDRPDVLFVLGFLKRRVLYRWFALSDVVQRLALPVIMRWRRRTLPVDEIGDRLRRSAFFARTARPSAAGAAARDADWAIRGKQLLAHMTQRLQGCETIEDVISCGGAVCAEYRPDDPR